MQIQEKIKTELHIYFGRGAFTSFDASIVFEKELDALLQKDGLLRQDSGEDLVYGIRNIVYAQDKI